MKTYTAARAISIQSHDFKEGEELGTGDIEQGKFTAADGLSEFVSLGHVIPRVADGRVVESSTSPGPQAATSAGPGVGRKSKKTTPSKGK